jgi:ABC-type microcin C transport system permease subunit YejB
MRRDRLVRLMIRAGIRLAGIAAIVFLVVQLAPGGPVDRFFFDLAERAFVGDRATGGIR